MLLALAGGVVGLGLADLLVKSVRGVGEGIVPRLAEVGIDPLVFAFTFGLSLVTGVVFGVAPALQSVRGDLTAAVAALGRASGTRHTARPRDALVVAQVALSLVLLVGAGLLLRSLWKLQHVEPGFDASNVLTASIALPENRGGGDTRFSIEGQPPLSDADARFAMVNVVGDEYFETMRIRVVAGRSPLLTSSTSRSTSRADSAAIS